MASSSAGLDLEYLLETTIGCGLVGAILSQLLYGVSLAQAVYYFWIYPKDPRGLKLLVVWWMLLDTIKEAISIEVLYEDLITNHANIESISHLSIAYGAQNVLGWLLVFSVHCFYINNMRSILQYNKQRKLITVVAFVLAVLTFLTSSAVIDYAIYYKGKFNHMSLVALAPPCLVIITDLYITLFLCLSLGTARSGLRSPTETLVNQLIKYNADRGIILCLVQLAALATYIYDIHTRTTNTTAVLYFAEINVYCNTGLAALNMRRHVRGAFDDQYSVEIMPVSKGNTESNNTSRDSSRNTEVTDQLKKGIPRIGA